MATTSIFDQTLGHYRLLERLGEGGMGVVYRAHDERLQRDVAVKVLPPNVVRNDTARRKFRREALTLARLNHPNIETLHDFETDADVEFLVTEFIPGITLASKLVPGPLRESELIEYAIQLASALEEAHNHGVIHRDLKPSNVLITSGGQVKVLDFGLAQLLTADEQTETASEASVVAGTLPYIAPEQLSESRSVDRRTDLYSLGVVLYEMATGRRPYREQSVASLLEAILHREPSAVRSLNPAVSPELESIIRKAMDKNPALRYQRARELKVDLQRLLPGRNLVSLPATAWSPLRRRRVTAVLASATVLSLGLVFLTFHSWKAHPATGLPPAAPRVVAVLPFDAVGGNPNHQVLCRGLTDLITTRLTQISKQYGVEVVPASEVRSQGVTSIGDARLKLGVSLVVEGSWDFSGKHVTYSLVNAQNRRSLDAEWVRADLSDVFSVEREVSEGLLRMIAGELRPDRGTSASDIPASYPDAYEYYVRGVGYLLNYQDTRSLQAAVELFQSALDRDSTFAPALSGTAEAYWRLFQETKDGTWIPRAVDVCRRARELNDRLASVHVTMGLIYQGTSKYAEAIEEFRRALALDATSDAAYRGLASSYQAMGQDAGAEAAYRQAIELRRDYWGGYSALGAFYYKLARYDEAAAQFQRVIELAPENVRGYSNLAGIYLLQGKTAQAEDMLRKSLAIEPNYRSYANLGALYFSEGRYSESAQGYEKALQFNNRDARVWRNLGDAYFWASGERAKAVPAYQRAAELFAEERKIDPRDPKLMVELALCQAMLGKSREAVELIRRAHMLSPSDPEIMFRAAEIYQQNGDHAAALDWLERSVRNGYSPSEIQHDPTFQDLREDRRFQQLVRETPARPNS